MNEVIAYIKGYKLYFVLGAYIIVVLISGEAPMGDDSIFASIDAAQVEKALLASAGIAAKAFFNRTWGKGDGVG
jgi:hypothetical protein